MDFRSSTHGFVIMNFPVSNLWVSLQWFLPFSIKSFLVFFVLFYRPKVPSDVFCLQLMKHFLAFLGSPSLRHHLPADSVSLRGPSPRPAAPRACAVGRPSRARAPLRAPARPSRHAPPSGRPGEAKAEAEARPWAVRAPPHRPAIHRRGWPTAPKSVLLVRRRAPEGRGQLLRQEAAA